VGRSGTLAPCPQGLRIWPGFNGIARRDSFPGAAVLRIYEHDPALCQKELDLLAFPSIPSIDMWRNPAYTSLQ
jgi:hypothetical protein